MAPLIERRKISVAPICLSSPMPESMESKQLIKGRTQKQGFMSFFSCKHHKTTVEVEPERKKKTKVKRIGWSGSLCNLRESSRVTHDIGGTTKKALSSSSVSSALITPSSSSSSSSSTNSVGGSFRGMHLRRLSGCYECHTVVDPVTGVSRVPSLRTSVFPCSDCGELFTRPESVELHQAVRHAVSELGPEDNSRNIVEIIFKSSWLKKEETACKIVRVLKVHHSRSRVAEFEEFRDAIKSKANKLAKKHPRCVADGNELLRFHSTASACSLGANGSTGLCASTPSCGVCGIVKDGFRPDESGRIGTMATSGRAHDVAAGGGRGPTEGARERAMLVCRVIAGRTRKKNDEGSSDEFDSVAGASPGGVYCSLDELFVFDPKAILPCFVVIYKSL